MPLLPRSPSATILRTRVISFTANLCLPLQISIRRIEPEFTAVNNMRRDAISAVFLRSVYKHKGK